MLESFPIHILKNKEWPEGLSEIPQVPKNLYIRGKLPESKFTLLAVVGSRKYTPYGKEVCKKLIAGLAGYPIAIVSGLALGIDAIAHEAALDAGLPTIAVPGSGLDEKILYPRSNTSLAKRILEKGGCLLSEFERDIGATTWTFPQRNRIMAGISKATLVIEADIKSGTLITARLATEYNRDVLTVPQSIFSSTSEGPLMLLKLGATPIGKSEDILEALGFDVLKASETKQQKLFDDLDGEEKLVAEALASPLSREELLETLHFDISKLNSLLTLLEIKGVIKEVGGKIYLA
jgi:DNA processing protein